MAGAANGLQTTGIYWEHGQHPHNRQLGGKFSWELMDDRLRRLWGVNREPGATPFGFVLGGKDRLFLRETYGSNRFSELTPLKKQYTFSLYPPGLAESYYMEMDARTETVQALFRAALFADVKSKLESA